MAKPNKLLELDGEIVVLGTPNIFVRQEVERRYAELVQQACEQTLGYPVQLLVVISPLVLWLAIPCFPALCLLLCRYMRGRRPALCTPT